MDQDVKPGSKTSEFLVAMLSFVTAIALPTIVLWGWTTPESADAFEVVLVELVKGVVAFVGVAIPFFAGIKTYIESRTRVKEAAILAKKK